MTTLLAAVVCASIALGQPNKPAFEVTAVKPNLERRSPVMECSPDGRFLARGLLLRPIILWAFDLQYFQLSAVPGPAGNTLFDIEGKAARPVSERECKQMVQALFEQRFKMSIRSEPKDVSVYALVVGKDGLKIPPVTDSMKDPGVGLRVNGRPYPFTPSDGWSMEELRDALGSAAIAPDRPVVNRTGLDGRYKVELNIIVGGTDLFSAASQLGLKVESRKESFQMVVIDRMDMPDEN